MIREIVFTAILLVFPSVSFAQESTSEAETSLKVKYELAIQYFQREDHVNAHNAFADIVKDEPEPFKAIVIYNMALCLQIHGVNQRDKDEELSKALFEQAAIYYQEVQKMMPYFPALYSNMALVYYYQHKPDIAVNEMGDAAQKLTDEWGSFPGDVNGAVYSYRSYAALLSIAVNYVAAAKFSDAASMLQGIVGQMEEAPPQKEYLQYTAYNSLGLSLYALGDIKGAIHSIETSVEKVPSQPKLDISYANLGMFYFTEKEYTKAKEAVDKALAINPNNETALDYSKRLKDTLGGSEEPTKQDGPYKTYYENGLLKVDGTFKDGKAEGPYKVYYQSGELQVEGVFKDSKIDGPYREYYKNRQLRLEGAYRDDKQDGPYKEYYESGNIKDEGVFKDGRHEGVYRTYYESGKLKEEGSSKDGNLDGVIKVYYESGALEIEETYKDGKREGTTKEYYENGQLKEEGTYRDNRV